MTAIRRRVLVSGRVQGVFFRASTADEAARTCVAGWVRNRSDGRVEAVFEGEQADVERLVAFASRGPAGAQVQDAEVTEETPEGLTGFEVR